MAVWVVGGPTSSDAAEGAAPAAAGVVPLRYAATTVLQPHTAALAAVRHDRLLVLRNARNTGRGRHMYMAARRTCDRIEDSTCCTCKYYDCMSNECMYDIVTGSQISHRTCQGYHTYAC